MSLLPPEAHDVWLCDVLGITYTELVQQPATWVSTYIAYLEGKGKAEELKYKKKQA